jgi:hypothetical protein
MNTLYIYLLIFACIAYLIITDPSIAKAVVLLSQIVKFQFEKTKWMILNDPRNPIVRWNMERRSYKLAKELQDEMERRSKTTNDDSTTFK